MLCLWEGWPLSSKRYKKRKIGRKITSNISHYHPTLFLKKEKLNRKLFKAPFSKDFGNSFFLIPKKTKKTCFKFFMGLLFVLPKNKAFFLWSILKKIFPPPPQVIGFSNVE